GDFAAVDVGIVRGLAYYTGIVFEVFDRAGKFRAIAGGGRYDNLVGVISDRAIDLYIVIAKEERRADALRYVQQLRERGYRVDYPLAYEKVARQFQAAEDSGARFAILFGDEWPEVKIKSLESGRQELVPHNRLLAHLQGFSGLSS